MGQERQLRVLRLLVKRSSLEVSASVLTTIHGLTRPCGPCLTPGWALQWHSLDVRICLAPSQLPGSQEKSPPSLSSVQPPSLWPSVDNDSLLEVGGEVPASYSIPVSLKSHRSPRASWDGWGLVPLLSLPIHPFPTGSNPDSVSQSILCRGIFEAECALQGA